MTRRGRRRCAGRVARPGSVNLGIAVAVLAVLAAAAAQRRDGRAADRGRVLAERPAGHQEGAARARPPPSTAAAKGTPPAPAARLDATAATPTADRRRRRVAARTRSRSASVRRRCGRSRTRSRRRASPTGRATTAARPRRASPATRIYIAVPDAGEHASSSTPRWQNFFNKRFQFYGRKMVLEYCSSSGGRSGLRRPGQPGGGRRHGRGRLRRHAAAVRVDVLPAEQRRLLHARRWRCRYKTIVRRLLLAVRQHVPQPVRAVPVPVPDGGRRGVRQHRGVGLRPPGRSQARSTRPAPTPRHRPKQLTTLPRKFGILLEPFTDDDPVLSWNHLARCCLDDTLGTCRGSLRHAQMMDDYGSSADLRRGLLFAPGACPFTVRIRLPASAWDNALSRNLG